MKKTFQKLRKVRVRKRSIFKTIGLVFVSLSFGWTDIGEAPTLVRNLAWGSWIVVVIASLFVFLIEIVQHITSSLNRKNPPDGLICERDSISLSEAIAELLCEYLIDNVLDTDEINEEFTSNDEDD